MGGSPLHSPRDEAHDMAGAGRLVAARASLFQAELPVPGGTEVLQPAPHLSPLSLGLRLSVMT